MKRKILSILLSVVMIVLSLMPGMVFVSAAVWNGTTVVPSMTGGVYQLATAENLAWFAAAVNTGSATLKGKLTADIQLNSAGSTANVWTPIGTEANPFSGTFDGDGHTISGMYVNATQSCAGFFGYVSYSTNEPEDDVSPEYIVGTKTYTIKNINIVDSTVRGTQNVGGIAGYTNNAGITDCTFSGTVIGTENSVGGIVGWATASSVVNQCNSSGTLNGHLRVGGIVGYCGGNSVTIKCYGDMNISGYMNVGGVIGTLASATMLGCFFLGSVSADDRAGGLAGYCAFGKMLGGYTVSTITNTGTGTDFGGAVGVIYGGEYSSIFYSFEDSGYDGPEGLGRTVTEMKASNFIKEVNHYAPYFCFDYTEINNGYPVLTWMLQLDVWAGDQTMPSRNAAGTYLITKPSELAWFAGLVNGTLNGFDPNPAANADVMDNLLFNISAFDDTMGRTEWTPIGTTAHQYTGTFNGNGYNIAGLYTSPTAGENGKNVGLFGYVGTGAVKGVVVVDGYIRGIENVGGIAGTVSGGSIMNCVCNSEIEGDKAVGGIAGFLVAETSKVTTCAMIGTINVTNISNEQAALLNIGGVVGYSNRATVNKSFASTTINAPLAKFVGGVVGNNSQGTISSCYSTSTIIGNVQVGGLVGKNTNGTVTKCYTAGKVSGTQQPGMAFGETIGANVTYCYYDESFKSTANTVSGATPKTPAQMTGSSSVSNLNLGSDFKATADDTYFYYYPQIYTLTYSAITALKNASLQSVKRVQSKYIARVEIDGRTDTYYETLESAFEYAENTESSVLPTVFLVRDKEISATINITSEVCFFGENASTLSRASTLTGAMFNVTGNLTIGSYLYGDDNDKQLFIDGSDVLGTTSAIVVQNGATLKVQPGVSVKNCRALDATVRGAAVNSSGTVIIAGGEFSGNDSKTVAGAIYNESGTITISGGTFTGNTCNTRGGVLCNNNGTVTITGGVFYRNIASLYGGAVTGTGVYSETRIGGTAQFVENEATYGGAVAVQSYGTLEVNGGSFISNRGYSQAGAIHIMDGAETLLTGGTIKSNYVMGSDHVVISSAIYNDATLSLKGSIQLDSDNDIYLPSGRYVTIADRLTCLGHAAKITPQVYAEGTKVLNGSALGSNYTKLGLSNSAWHILASGKITNTASTTVAMLSKNHSYSVEYVSLLDAFAAVGDDETAIITVVADSYISDIIPVHGDVTVLCDNTHIAMRNGSYHGVMFDVQPGAILRFGDSVLSSEQQAQSDYNSGTTSAAQFILDGGASTTGVVGAAAVNVQYNGQFYMYDGAIIRNCTNTTTGTVTVSGTMHMYGGTICNNSALTGGGVYVKAGGELKTYGGVIANNASTNGGEAVYAIGKVTRNINSYKFMYVETIYDEDTGDVAGTADPVYMATLKTDILIGNNDRVFLKNNLIYVAETETEIFITNLSKLPASTSFTLNDMTIDLETYTVGNVAVTGINVVDYFVGFTPYLDGYYVMSDGKLGINKLVVKQNSGYRIDRTKNVLSGIELDNNKVSTVISKFVNISTLLRVVNAKGSPLRNSATVTTGCKVRLLNASGTIIDEVSIVVYGDLNADEKIDGCDAVLIRAVATGMLNSSNATVAQIEAADVNGDGTPSLIDAEQVEACGVLLQTIEQVRQ